MQHVVIIGSLGFIAIVTLLHIVGKVGGAQRHRLARERTSSYGLVVGSAARPRQGQELQPPPVDSLWSFWE